MLKKSEIELEKARIAKVTRTLIRLQYSLLADIEINNVLPDRINEFEAALQGGELLRIPSGFNELLEEFDLAKNG